MDEMRAREILGEMIQTDGGLSGSWCYVGWAPGEDRIVIDGDLDLDELQAIAWWVQNFKP